MPLTAPNYCWAQTSEASSAGKVTSVGSPHDTIASMRRRVAMTDPEPQAEDQATHPAAHQPDGVDSSGEWEAQIADENMVGVIGSALRLSRSWEEIV